MTCQSYQLDADPEAARKADAAEAQSDPQGTTPKTPKLTHSHSELLCLIHLTLFFQLLTPY